MTHRFFTIKYHPNPTKSHLVDFIISNSSNLRELIQITNTNKLDNCKNSYRLNLEFYIKSNKLGFHIDRKNVRYNKKRFEKKN